MAERRAVGGISRFLRWHSRRAFGLLVWVHSQGVALKMLVELSPLMPRRADGSVAIVEELPRSATLYEPFRENTVSVKTRLPLLVWNALSVAGEVDFQRRSKFARELVFIHLYGRYDFEMMRECEDGFFYVAPVFKESIEFEDDAYLDSPAFLRRSPESEWRHALGEATRELVLSMPELMHKHILQIAFDIDRTAGRTLRQIIVNELFGRRFSPELISRKQR